MGILFCLKYFNFFVTEVLSFSPISIAAAKVLLLGISFYTFKAMSYTIDVNRNTQEPVRHFGRFLLYH
jgi:D-alanyl-lipoteichoic acid acyltransferase DltB (MBOAT superfamily)